MQSLTIWAVFLVVSFVVLFFLYLFIGILLQHQIASIVVLGVLAFGFWFWHREENNNYTLFNSAVLVAYVLLFSFVVWASVGGTSPSDSGTHCRIEDRGGRIREYCP